MPINITAPLTGVFVDGVYTCAGTTRALGRVLDYMGYGWQHVNENKWVHQWCIMTMANGAGAGTSRRIRPGRRRKRTKIWKPQQVFPPPSGGKGIF